MIVGYILLFFGLVFLSGSALVAFYWAARNGQFSDLKAASESIFDEDEPIGKMTDYFPEKSSKRAKPFSSIS